MRELSVKKLKRYQYERYAVLCNLAYSRVLKQTRYGFAPNGQRVIANRFGKPMMRVLWSNDSEEVIVVIKGIVYDVSLLLQPHDALLQLVQYVQQEPPSLSLCFCVENARPDTLLLYLLVSE